MTRRGARRGAGVGPAVGLAALVAAGGLLLATLPAQAVTPAVDPAAPTAPSPSPSPTASASPSATGSTAGRPAEPDPSGSDTGPQRPTPPPKVIVDPAIFGMHVFGIQDGVWPSIKVGSIRLWDNDTSWAYIERRPGVFDWTKLDAAVANAEQHNVRDIMLVLAATPKWAANAYTPIDRPLSGSTGVPRTLDWWDRWVRKVTKRYKGRITSYQIWNEANLTSFFNGTPEQMGEMTERAYRIIKRVDPAATVVAPSTGTRLQSPYVKFYTAFLADLALRGWPVDALSGHFYPVATGTPVDRRKLIEDWKSRIAAAGAPERIQLWDTEVNFGLAGPGPAYPDQDIEGTQAADWAARAYLDAIRLGLSRVYWFAWTQDIDLLGIQMRPKSTAAVALRTLQGWVSGATYDGCTERKDLVTCRFTKRGRTATIAWAESGTAAVKVPEGASKSCTLDGACTPVQARARVQVTGPVRFTP